LSESHQKPRIDRHEFAAGIVLLLVGGAAAMAATDFDSESKLFPLVVATSLAVIGVVILIRAFLRPMERVQSFSMPASVGLAGLVIAAWAAAFAGGAGFVLPTFGMQALLLWLSGLRQPVQLTSIAALITFLAYLLFVVVLEIPLPVSFLPSPLQGF
jgi:hypothetical protein